MILKNSKLLLVTLSLIFVILLVFIIFAIYDIRAKNKETSNLLNEIEEVVEIGGLSQSIRTIQSSDVENITTFNDLVFESDKLVPLIESIEEVGRKLGLDTKTVSVEKEEDVESFELDLIRIVVEADGSWTEAFSFLHAIESLPHRVIIDESNLSKIGDNWRLRITLALYLFD